MSQQPSGEKSEKATPRKRRQARENAQVLKSTELISAFSMLALFGSLSLFGEQITGNLKGLLIEFLGGSWAIPEVTTVSSVSGLMAYALEQTLLIVAPLLLVAFACGLILNYLQVGFILSSKSIMPKMERISLFAGLKRIFSKQSLAQLIKATIKIVVLGVIGYQAFMAHTDEMPPLMWFSIPDAVAFMVSLLMDIAFKFAIALAVLAPVDLFYEWRKREKELMMSKQEIRDEYKLTEGDPQIKSQIRRKQRQISGMRMIQAVEKADVVVTNPTHYAIALIYDDKNNKAPVVLAKGKDYLAKKIKEKAAETNITMVENRELAQALYFYCDIGDEVPEELYQAVAEILAYVYRLKNKVGSVRK